MSKREFGLFDRVSLDRNGDGRFEHCERILETGGETGFELLGRNTGEVQPDATRYDVQVASEESGPERVVIRVAAPTRVEGPRGHEHGFAVRIFAYAGLPFVKVDYQLQNSDKKVLRAGPLYFDSLTLNLGIDGLDHRITRFGAEGGRLLWVRLFRGRRARGASGER